MSNFFFLFSNELKVGSLNGLMIFDLFFYIFGEAIQCFNEYLMLFNRNYV